MQQDRVLCQNEFSGDFNGEQVVTDLDALEHRMRGLDELLATKMRNHDYRENGFQRILDAVNH